MNEVLVEVFFEDKLQSIRVDQQQMEIPNAIKAKSIKEWFEPATGRVKWAGLPEESRRMNHSGAEDSKFVFSIQRAGSGRAGIHGLRAAESSGRRG